MCMLPCISRLTRSCDIGHICLWLRRPTCRARAPPPNGGSCAHDCPPPALPGPLGLGLVALASVAAGETAKRARPTSTADQTSTAEQDRHDQPRRLS